MPTWTAIFRCSNPECRAFVSGKFCKFCRSELEPKQGLKQVLASLGKPVRTILTFLETAFTPWRIGSYLGGGKRGAISGPVEMLSYTVTFYVGGFFVALGLAPSSISWKTQALIYAGLGLTYTYVLSIFHAFLKSFGSAKRLLDTVEAAAYPMSLGLLALAVLVRLRIGNIFCLINYDLQCDLPKWQFAVENGVMLWLWLVVICVEARLHSLKWYKVVASSVLLIPVLIGWHYFLLAISMHFSF